MFLIAIVVSLAIAAFDDWTVLAIENPHLGVASGGANAAGTNAEGRSKHSHPLLRYSLLRRLQEPTPAPTQPSSGDSSEEMLVEAVEELAEVVGELDDPEAAEATEALAEAAEELQEGSSAPADALSDDDDGLVGDASAGEEQEGVEPPTPGESPPGQSQTAGGDVDVIGASPELPPLSSGDDVGNTTYNPMGTERPAAGDVENPVSNTMVTPRPEDEEPYYNRTFYNSTSVQGGDEGSVEDEHGGEVANTSESTFEDTSTDSDDNEVGYGEFGIGEAGDQSTSPSSAGSGDGEGEVGEGDSLVNDSTPSPTPLNGDNEGEGGNEEGAEGGSPVSTLYPSYRPTSKGMDWYEEERTPYPTYSSGKGDNWDWGQSPWGGGRPNAPTRSPTERPTVQYVPKVDGDPLAEEEELDATDFHDDSLFYHGMGGAVGTYLDGVESPREMERDKNVQVVAGTLAGLFLVTLLVTAHLVMQHPDGLCSGCCRLTLKFICCFVRTLCLPCRAICCRGSDQGQSRRTHAPMRTPFPTDLELA